MRSVAIGALIATLWAVSPRVAAATVVEHLSLERLAEGADAVLLGVVERSGVRLELTSRGLEPWTRTTLRVRQWIAGGDGASRVTVAELGGEHKNGGLRIAGTPQYRPGEEVLVFLRRDPAHAGAYRTYGMAQGKLVIRRGVGGAPDAAHRDLSDLALARFGQEAMRLEGGSDDTVQLEGLLALVRQVRSHVREADAEPIEGAPGARETPGETPGGRQTRGGHR
jgi:hypothetical protein